VVGAEAVGFNGVTGAVTVVLDVNAGFALNDVSGADPTKWTARFDDVYYAGTAMENVGNARILVSFTQSGIDTGESVMGYANSPSDVSDTQGRQLGQFEDFPL
jgi:hypothetical protein